MLTFSLKFKIWNNSTRVERNRRMTIQQAILELEFLISCSYVDSFEDSEKDALKVAIKVLNEKLKGGEDNAEREN